MIYQHQHQLGYFNLDTWWPGPDVKGLVIDVVTVVAGPCQVDPRPPQFERFSVLGLILIGSSQVEPDLYHFKTSMAAQG